MGDHLASETDWWEILWNSGFRRILNQLNPRQLAQLRRQHLEQEAALKTDGGIWLDVDVHYTQARSMITLWIPRQSASCAGLNL